MQVEIFQVQFCTLGKDTLPDNCIEGYAIVDNSGRLAGRVFRTYWGWSHSDERSKQKTGFKRWNPSFWTHWHTRNEATADLLNKMQQTPSNYATRG